MIALPRRRPLLVLVAALFLSSCGGNKIINSMVPEKERAVAEYYVDLLKTGNFYPIERDMDPSLTSRDLPATLQKMAAVLPKETPISTKIIGYDTWRSPEKYEANISFEFQYKERWIVANTATRTTKDGFTIIGLSVYRIPDSLENLHRFTLSNKSPLAYGILALAILIPLFIIYALVQCIRSKPRRRWLWIIFILLGIGKLWINWSTGAWGIAPLTFQLFGAAAFAEFYGPWTVSISLPLGAMVFLLLRKKIATRGVEKSLPADRTVDPDDQS